MSARAMYAGKGKYFPSSQKIKKIFIISGGNTRQKTVTIKLDRAKRPDNAQEGSQMFRKDQPRGLLRMLREILGGLFGPLERRYRRP